MKAPHPHARRSRALGALGVVVGLILILGAAFFRIQVLASGTYKLTAESNRLRPLEISAPRGTVFDRYGRVVADNVPAYAVMILPSSPDSVRATLERVRRHVALDDDHVESLLEAVEQAPNQPLLVDSDVDFNEVSALEERRSDFPNLYIEMRPKRRYLGGQAASHLMGYIGEIDPSELQSEDFPSERYRQGMVVGKTGVEREYERRLQGTSGVRYVEVDARGRIVGDFGGSTLRPALAGQDLRLSIDLGLQEWIHQIFPEDKTGAVVALDPADGAVLALYSRPVFDPNAFVGGIDAESWEELNADTLNPLLNRAVQSVFPPASTFKPLVAAMGLDLGVVTPSQFMPIPCTGGMMYGGRYRRCWEEEGHGFVDLAGAIQHSCDVYYYQLGLEIGLDRFLRRGGELGLTQRCGIDLPEERRGIFPDGRDFWENRFGYTPRGDGEVLSLAIGQGPNSQSPLKVAQAYVALARDGTAPAPSLNLAREDAPGGWEMNLSREHLEAVRRGLRQVTAPGGTAYMSSLEHWDLLGKTGTGENYLSQQGLGDTDAWFAGMAGPRGGDPEIVVVVMVEQGGGGSATAAPLMAKTADYYLRRKHGIPVDTVQTLREHLRTRGWPTWARGEGG
jgi:penicillin-binding protein 2